MKYLFTALFFLIFVYSSLAQERYFEVTSGGGIAGTATRYQVDTGGRVKKGTGLGEISYSEEAKLKKCKARKCFRKARKLVNSYSDFNHPGNLYYSIKLYELGNGSQITWGDAGHKVPEDVEKLYQEIHAVLAGLTFAPMATK
jgi:hypothetical protein